MENGIKRCASRIFTRQIHKKNWRCLVRAARLNGVLGDAATNVVLRVAGEFLTDRLGCVLVGRLTN
jgi:hypothetical protein